MASDTKISADAFLDWFQAQGGTTHTAIGITTFPAMGRGAVALCDIKKNTILFTVPRSLTLSTRTSSLPSKFGAQEWSKYGLHKGWVGLILCMLWEEASGEEGKWSGYLSSLPDSFQTPMFWDAEDLQELQGTTILDKIGKADAEKDYHDKLMPAVKSRPDLFPTRTWEPYYSLHMYHIMGSRILSRSFHVERWGENLEGSADDHPFEDAMGSSHAMEVDIALPESNEAHKDEGVETEDDEEDEDPSDVAMVPLADMLNARYQTENAKLCHEAEDLQMISTRDICAGEQIWNTYGDQPNSDLLRRYGHVDLIPMAGGVEGNPADIVEIRADLVVDVLRMHSDQMDASSCLERIEWWLEEGGDDVFILETSFRIPQGLVSLIGLLTTPSHLWERTRSEGRIPKPKTDVDIRRVIETVLETRLGMYQTSLEEDELYVSAVSELSRNKHMATVVRVGEKRILKGTLEKVRRMTEEGRKRRNASEDVEAVRGSKKIKC